MCYLSSLSQLWEVGAILTPISQMPMHPREVPGALPDMNPGALVFSYSRALALNYLCVLCLLILHAGLWKLLGESHP